MKNDFDIDVDMERKVFDAVRSKYGYGNEGNALVDWLMDNLK